MALITPGERLWLTTDGRLVADGDPDAAVLFCTEHDQVDAGEVEALGWKQRKAPARTKERRPAGDKAGG